MCNKTLPSYFIYILYTVGISCNSLSNSLLKVELISSQRNRNFASYSTIKKNMHVANNPVLSVGSGTYKSSGGYMYSVESLWVYLTFKYSLGRNLLCFSYYSGGCYSEVAAYFKSY